MHKARHFKKWWLLVTYGLLSKRIFTGQFQNFQCPTDPKVSTCIEKDFKLTDPKGNLSAFSQSLSLKTTFTVFYREDQSEFSNKPILVKNGSKFAGYRVFNSWLTLSDCTTGLLTAGGCLDLVFNFCSFSILLRKASFLERWSSCSFLCLSDSNCLFCSDFRRCSIFFFEISSSSLFFGASLAACLFCILSYFEDWWVRACSFRASVWVFCPPPAVPT